MKFATWIVLSYLFLITSTQAASFDCATARTKLEKLICSDSELSGLDEQLTVAFTSRLDDEKNSAFVRQAQRQWLRQRNTCNDLDCVKAAYVERFKELNMEVNVMIASKLVEVPRTLDGRAVYLTYEQCRQARSENVMADCIEAKLYDLCGDASSLNRWALCGRPHIVVAERRIRRAEVGIIEFSRKSPGVSINPDLFAAAHRKWLIFRKMHCDEGQKAFANAYEAHIREQTNESTAEDQTLDMGIPESHCLRAITEQRADDLEAFLGFGGMKPDELDRKGLLEYLGDEGLKQRHGTYEQ